MIGQPTELLELESYWNVLELFNRKLTEEARVTKYWTPVIGT